MSLDLSAGLVIGPLSGNHGRGPLLGEFRETSPTYAKVVTKRENSGSETGREADVVAWQSSCRMTGKELWARRKEEEKNGEGRRKEVYR